MKKDELIKAVAEEAGTDAGTAGSVLAAFQDVVVKAVASGDSVALTGFLSFERVEKAATTARNPRTGESIDVPAKNAAKVKVGTAFKKAVEGK